MTEFSDGSSCLEATTLEALAGGMPATDAQAAHLVSCASCRAAVDSLGASIELLDAAVGAGLGESPDPDARVPGYRLMREIHRGGQGIVWLAEQTGTRRLVAIKMLIAGIAATSVQRRRFEREIEVVASLSDPAIVTIFEQGATADGVPYYAMEFVEGRRFDEWVADRSPSVRESVELIARIAAAVGTAHRRGIIHRDLKPGNILIDDTGLPRVLDFGLARLETEREFDATVAAMTEDGAFLGNFAYAAPEQLTGSPHTVDTSADVYALGLLLHEAITGAKAFPTPESIAMLVGQRVGRTPPRPSSLRAGVGQELDLIVLRALDPDPERRYATAGEFADDLTRLLDGRPVLARGDGAAYILWKAARRHALPTSIAAVSLILILSSIVALWMLYRESERRLQRAESVSKVYESAFEFVDPQAEGSIDLRAPDFIRRLERTARTALAEQPSDQAKMLLLAGDSFCNLELIDDADRCFRTGLELADSMGSPEARPLVAAAEHGLGRVDYFRGRDAGRRAEAARRQGHLAEESKMRSEAIQRFQSAIAHYEAAVEGRADDPVASRADHAMSMQHLAGTRFALLRVDGDAAIEPAALKAVESKMLEVQRLVRTLDPPDLEFEAGTWNAIAAVREARQDPDGAIEAARRAADLAGDAESSAWAGRAQASLGTRLLRAGRPGDAIAPLTRGVATCRSIYGDDSSITRRYWGRLLEAELADGRFEDGLDTLARLGDLNWSLDERRELDLFRIDALAGMGRLDEARAMAVSLQATVGEETIDRELSIRRHLLGVEEAAAPDDGERAAILARWRWTNDDAAD